MTKMTKWLVAKTQATITGLLPAHSKRIMFLTALYNYAAQGRELSDEELSALNDEMGLVKRDVKALQLPLIILPHFNFGIDNPLAVLDFSNRDAIVRSAPPWLVYGRTEDLEADVTKLQRYVSTRLDTTA